MGFINMLLLGAGASAAACGLFFILIIPASYFYDFDTGWKPKWSFHGVEAKSMFFTAIAMFMSSLVCFLIIEFLGGGISEIKWLDTTGNGEKG